MPKYSAVAWERAMKVQEVILRAMAKKITWWQAAEIIGLSDRSMRRWRRRYEEHGYDGLLDRRWGKPSPKRVPLAQAEEVLRLYQEKYAQLVEEESTRTVMAGLWEVIERKGRFCALYSDRASHFFHTPAAGGPVSRERLSQVGRALQGLGIQMIAAYSPQARGRSERRFGTWQGRLPQELRLAQITGVEEANRFLREHYIGEMNRKFSVPAAQTGHAFMPVRGQDLDLIFSVQHERAVAQDNTVRLADRTWQIERTSWRGTLAGCRVTICEHLDGRVTIAHGPHVVGRYTASGEVLEKAEKARAPRCGNAAPRKAWKTPKTSFPLFSPRLEIRHKTPDSHIPTATTAAVALKIVQEKKNQNRTDHLL